MQKKVRSRPALKKAKDYLSGLIRAHKKEGKLRLPTVHELAHDAGVSRDVMGKAVTAFTQHGAIQARQGKGIMIVSAENISASTRKNTTNPASTKSLANKWYLVAKELEKDIITGIYPSYHPLPSQKELTARYGVSKATLQKALDFIVSEGIVRSQNRELIPQPTRVTHRNASILVLLRERKQQSPVDLHDYLYFTIQNCTKVNISTEFIFYTFMEGKQHLIRTDKPALDTPTIEEIDDSLGVIIFFAGLEPLDHVRIIYKTLSQNRPVAIFDESGQFQVPKGLTSKYLIRHFVKGCTPLAGIDMGRFLMSLGHRHIVYISPQQNTIWSQNRFAGLTEIISTNSHCSIEGITANDPCRNLDWQTIWNKRDEFFAAVRNCCSKTNNPSFMEHCQAIETLSPLLQNQFNEKNRKTLLRKLFEEALQHSDCSAWVCANDSIALEALAFLKERNVNVPRDLSIVGFDDSFDAHVSHLTSYNFNAAAITHAMVSHIVDPKHWHWVTSPDKPVEIGGYVVERGTTRRL